MPYYTELTQLSCVELFSGDGEQTCFACDLYTSLIYTHVALYVNTSCGILGHC